MSSFTEGHLVFLGLNLSWASFAPTPLGHSLLLMITRSLVLFAKFRYERQTRLTLVSRRNNRRALGLHELTTPEMGKQVSDKFRS